MQQYMIKQEGMDLFLSHFNGKDKTANMTIDDEEAIVFANKNRAKEVKRQIDEFNIFSFPVKIDPVIQDIEEINIISLSKETDNEVEKNKDTINNSEERKDRFEFPKLSDITISKSTYSMSDIERSIEIIEREAHNLVMMKRQLHKDFHQNDRERIDLLHKIEQDKKVKTSEGYRMYALLRDLLRERRKIKDCTFVIQKILGYKLVSSTSLSVKLIIDRLSKRKYSPRELDSLFEEDI